MSLKPLGVPTVYWGTIAVVGVGALLALTARDWFALRRDRKTASTR